jgi:hypothetical protein
MVLNTVVNTVVNTVKEMDILLLRMEEAITIDNILVK